MSRKSNEDHFVLSQSLDRYVDSIQSSRPYKWLLVQPRFYCQDEASHTFIAKTGAAMLSLPKRGQPCFHRQDEGSHDFICQRQDQPRFYCQDEASDTLPRRGQLRYYRRDGASHTFIAKTGAAMLSLPKRGQPCFHRQDEGSHDFICQRQDQPRFYCQDEASDTLPRRGQLRYHRQDGASHIFIAKTGAAMLSSPRRAATLFLPPHS